MALLFRNRGLNRPRGIAHASAGAATTKPVFQECHTPDGASRLAIRRMQVDGNAMLLTVDPDHIGDAS